MAIGCVIRKNFERPSAELVETFKDLPVANIDDCMGRMAAIDSAIRPINGTPILGTAFTVRCPAGDNLMFHKAMDLAQPGDIIMIDAGGYTNRAIFGEIMVSYCKTKGVKGIVIDGAIRDYDALSKMDDFAVYAKGVTPNGPYKGGPGEIGTTITVGGITVNPGDIVVGDADGVIVISPAVAAELAEKARAVSKKEQEIFETMRRDGSYDRPWVDEKLKELGCTYLD